jgi:glycosyltransferase involved in cell wall biosynthesis
MMEIIYFTRFMPTCDRGGGSRRMMQMWEILKRLNSECHVVSTQRKDFLSMEALKRIEKNIPMDNKYRWWSEKRRKPVYRLSEISREWSRGIREIPRLELAVLDDPIYFVPLMEKLNRCCVPVTAICHNLEALASQQVENQAATELLQKELELLSCCHLVVTISREENWLLNNLRIPSLFYPYYPVAPILDRLLEIRENRKTGKKEGILLVGTAANVQTREGMHQAMSYWQENQLDRLAGKLLVAGYDTGKFFKPAQLGSSIELLGTLSNDDLDKHLAHVKACLCFQESGSGALTRICEMLIAGVPVLANSHAARSYYNRKGLIEFLDLNDLERALDQVDELDGQIPIPQGPDSSHLVSEIKKIIEQHSSSQPLTKSF